jgi:HTH-type transcriptional regulator/antitoxin HigA
LKYRVIKSDTQYLNYCNDLELLDLIECPSIDQLAEIELLSLLINDYDRLTRYESLRSPIDIIRSLMFVNKLTQSDMAAICGVGKSYMSEVLNGKKDLSKGMMRSISSHFAISQDVLNP